MEKEVTVSNTSSLIFMGKLNVFSLAKQMYTKILVPKEVVSELFRFDKPENNVIREELEQGFIQEVSVKDVMDLPLDSGEKAALSLCVEKKIVTLLSDDKTAREYAYSLGISAVGVIGIILQNMKGSTITKKKARELLDMLITEGYYLSSDIYAEVLRLIEAG